VDSVTKLARLANSDRSPLDAMIVNPTKALA
jgi:hypothetical protein